MTLISLRGVTRTYHMGDSEVHALRGIDLDIHAGEFVAIVGPSGSGKSSLMYLLGLLDRPTAGSYRLDGEEVSGLSDTALSRLRGRSIGYIFQSFNLLAGLDAVDNAALPLVYAGAPRAARRARGEELAAQVGLGHRLHHVPAELSGGQMQRVAIARGLAARPRLILADEPTGALDSHTGAEIFAMLRSLHAEGNTVVIVTHDPAIAGRADRVVRIVDGAITADGPGDAGPVAPVAAHPPAAPAGTGLGWRDVIAMAWRDGLAAHRLRTALTMLGIVFGVAAVIAMTAITEGGKQAQLDSIRRIGRNAVQVLSEDLTGARLARERRLCPDGVTIEDRDLLVANLAGVEGSIAWKVIPAEVRRGRAVATSVQVHGIAGDVGLVAGVSAAHGRLLVPDDGTRLRRVCVLGADAARQLADAGGIAAAPGDLIVVGDQTLAVVGVLAPVGTADSPADRDRQVLMPLEVLKAYYRKIPRDSQLDGIALRMADEATLVARAEEARRIVAARHDGAADHRVVVPIEQLRQAQQTKEVFNILITVIAAISLIVGGIGIMNIMLASVTERTREIGVRRAVGASRGDILRQFVAEAGLIAALGGIVGLAAGIGAGLLIQAAFGFPVAFSPTIMAVAVGTSTAVGLAFGIYPAWRAAAMDPVEALRS